MTFSDALRMLDANGAMAAKRPCMAGYVTKGVTKTEPDENGAERSVQHVALTSRDGDTTVIPMDGTGAAGDYQMPVSEFFGQFVLPDDWTIAPAQDFETARSAGENRF